MKRIISVIILSHWLLFFLLQALGALAGSVSLVSIPSLSNAMSAFSAGGAIRAMPMISAGMGTAALLVATLFLWALLSSIFEESNPEQDGEVEKIAFGGGALVFSMLSVFSILDGDPSMLLASTGYFTALILSWGITRMEWLETIFSRNVFLKSYTTLPQSIAFARTMATSASHNNLLAKIAGRERN